MMVSFQVMSLEVAGRSFLALASLTPGVARADNGGAGGRDAWHDEGDPSLKLDQSLAGLTDGEVTVQLWLASKSPDVLAKFRALGFALDRDVKGRSRLVGRIPAKNLSALAALDVVRFVARA